MPQTNLYNSTVITENILGRLYLFVIRWVLVHLFSSFKIQSRKTSVCISIWNLFIFYFDIVKFLYAPLRLHYKNALFSEIKITTMYVGKYIYSHKKCRRQQATMSYAGCPLKIQSSTACRRATNLCHELADKTLIGNLL